jgi:preprotein translocase subunit SecA
MYKKLAGMTGTADTEAYEFQQIYNLRTVVLPTNKPMIREDMIDLIYGSEEEKYEAVVADIKEEIAKGRPVLVGTISIESSERLSEYLNKINIKHQVLNAKFHAQEAQIVAQAGRPGTVTIATNMAGRGTDIVLGGSLSADLASLQDPTPEQIQQVKDEWQKRHDAVVAAGGLHIIGTERHESRRIDNQLRGRAGRQGDPGSSRFYLSLDDNLLRIFGSDRIKTMMKHLGMERGEPIGHKLVSRAIENAQRKVETRNFDLRKNLLEFDDVANEQRKVIYEERNALLDGKIGTEIIDDIRADVYNRAIDRYISPNSMPENWDIPGLTDDMNREFALDVPVQQWIDSDDRISEEKIREKIIDEAKDTFDAKKQIIGEERAGQLVRNIMLQTLDTLWKEHLASMDYLRQGIGLRGYAQRNPKQEYKLESYRMFTEMLENFKYQVVRVLSCIQIRIQEVDEMEQKRLEKADEAEKKYNIEAEDKAKEMEKMNANSMFSDPNVKVGRNDPCPCGSGKKYKECHGRLV